MKLKQLNAYCWEVPKTGAMNVPGRVYASPSLIDAVVREKAVQQVANVAHLPGIVGASLAMPDIHWGYGFPIGGVAAFDWETGVISPGGVGYDINCGVRLAASRLTEADLRPVLDRLADALYRDIPSGIGSSGPIKLSRKEEKRLLRQGSRWAVEQGYGDAADIEFTEDYGCLPHADPEAISDRALGRGATQIGSLGSGNHFIEVGVVEALYQPATAAVFGLFEGQVTVMIHSGSRGLGYQICDDFLAHMARHVRSLGLQLPDRQLACAYIQSDAGQRYFSAMACAANYAWANRQVLLHRARETFMRVLNLGPRDLDLRLVYDICHNIAKRETHRVNGKEKVLCVHRKGATRAFPPGHADLCDAYRDTGQPILIPGDMGTASYVMAGTQKAMQETFGSTCHGAGRVLSRTAARKAAKGRTLHRELADKGIEVRWTGRSTLAEEMPEAYKDIDQVVDVVAGVGISEKVARIRPIVVIKG